MATNFPVNTYPHLIVNTSGIIHYMRFGESNANISGDDADSLSGFGANCTNEGSAIVGESNPSRRFNGSNSYISYGNTNALSGPFTVEVWVNPAVNYTSGFPTFLSKENWGAGGYQASGWSFYIEGRSSGGMRLAFSRHGHNAITRVYGLNNLPASAWTHVGVTYDNSTLRMYQNGTLTWETPSANSMNTSAYPFIAGAASNFQASAFSDWYNGRLDELAIYNRSLTGTELRNHYEKALTPPNTNTYMTGSDTGSMASSETHSLSGSMEMSDTQTLGRVETYSALGLFEYTDAVVLGSTEVVDSIVTEFGGDKLSLSDASTMSAAETRVQSAVMDLTDDASFNEDVSSFSALAVLPLSDAHKIEATEEIEIFNIIDSRFFGKIHRERMGLLDRAVHGRFSNAAKIQFAHDVAVRIGIPEDEYFLVQGEEGRFMGLGRMITTWDGPRYASRPLTAHEDVQVVASNAHTTIEIFKNPYDYPDILAQFDLPEQSIG